LELAPQYRSPAKAIAAINQTSRKAKRGDFAMLRKENLKLPPPAFLELFPARLSVLRFLGAFPLELLLFPGATLKAI
jgi:hypothetical protein